MRGVMVDLFGPHRADDAEVVRVCADVGEEVTDFDASLAVFLIVDEGAAGLKYRPLQLRELLSLGEGFGEGLAVELLECWLPVEGLEVRGAARHTEIDDAFRLHGEVRGLQEAL